MSTDDTYRALASGDPGMVRKFAPRVAALAATARKAHASVPSPAAIAPRAPAPLAALPVPAPRPLTKKAARRAAANDMAQRQGLPTDQAAIDDRWSALAAQLNANVPPATAPRSTPSASRAAPQSQASIDDMWGSLATDLNKKAGLATPVMDRAR
jgi:hypothetical protein